MLAAAGSGEPRARLWNLHVPPEFEPFKRADREAWEAGRPHAFDPDMAMPPG